MKTQATALALLCAASALAADPQALSPGALGRIDAPPTSSPRRGRSSTCSSLNVTAVNVCVVDHYR